MHLSLYVTIAIVLLHGSSVNADYDCVCNNGDGPMNVMNATDESSIPIGNVNVGSCVAHKKFIDQQWLSVIYKHQVGYILNSTDVTIATCAYDPRPEDRLTTQVPMKTEKGDIQLTTSGLPVSHFMSSTSSVQTPNATVAEQTIVTSETLPTTTVTLNSLQTTSMNEQTSNKEHAHLLTSFTTSVLPSQSSTSPTAVLTSSPVTTETLPTTMMASSSLSTTLMNVQTSSVGMSILKGHVELCPHRIQQLVTQYPGELLAQFGQNCYEVINSGVSWSHAETNCKKYGGHLIHIANQQEQNFIYDFLVKHHTHTVWLGLNDRNTEEKFEWTSGNNVTYENWKPGRKDFRDHNYEDCVFMTPTTGEWDDVKCGGNNPLAEIIQGIRHAYICQYAVTTPNPVVVAVTTPYPVVDGNIYLCSHRLQQQAQRDKGILAQHENSCYELVTNAKVSWQHAEEKCTSRGGHLVYITSAQEQTFVQNFMKSHYPDHAVWIGLTDSHTEGRFHWASGTHADYTNWVPGHSGNFVSSSQEDCVVFIPYKNGQWDDIPCGQTHHHFFGGTSSSGETHPLLCEYSISTGPSFIG